MGMQSAQLAQWAATWDRLALLTHRVPNDATSLIDGVGGLNLQQGAQTLPDAVVNLGELGRACVIHSSELVVRTR